MVTPDPRLGYRNENGVIVAHPERWVIGTPYNRLIDPCVTQYWFDDYFFVVVPMLFGRLPDFVLQELQEKINKWRVEQEPVVVVKKTTKKEVSSDVDEEN